MTEKLKLVVLIDGENITGDYADEILRETADLGEVVVRRVYLPHDKKTQKWTDEVIHRHGIEPIYKICYVSGKKITDIALVVDAMDLMYRGHLIYDGFCIVSSDSDFTVLTMRLREGGFKVFGFGDERSRRYYGPSCNQFIPLTKSPDTEPAEEEVKAEKEAKEKGVKMVINAIQKTEKEWVSLGMIGKYLREIDREFKINHYGYKTLKKLVTEKSDFFETRPGKDANNLDVRMREKNEE